MKANRIATVLGLASILVLAACAPAAPATPADTPEEGPVSIIVGASVDPHSYILRHIEPYLAEEGILLDIREFTDFATLNPALVGGDVDANFFQHTPFLETFMEDSGEELVAQAHVFIAPLALHSTEVDSVEDIPEGATIAVPNDVTNHARALRVLEYHGLIEIDEAAGALATEGNITGNPLGLQFVAVDAPMLPAALQDTGFAVINVSIALQAGMNPAEDAIARETAIGSPYLNVFVTRSDNADDPAFARVAYWLQSDSLRDFILESYGGNIVPGF